MELRLSAKTQKAKPPISSKNRKASLTCFVCNLAHVCSLNLCRYSDEGLAKSILGRGVQHLLLDLGVIRRPNMRQGTGVSRCCARLSFPLVERVASLPFLFVLSDPPYSIRIHNSPGVKADLVSHSLFPLLIVKVVDGIAAFTSW
jgi:hypothetical protein